MRLFEFEYEPDGDDDDESMEATFIFHDKGKTYAGIVRVFHSSPDMKLNII